MPVRAPAQSVQGYGTNASCNLSGSTVDCESYYPNTTNLTIVTLVNGTSTSNPINYTLLGHPYGIGPDLSGYGTVLGYSGYGVVPSDTYPSLPYVQGPDITVNDQADIYSYSAYGYPAGYGLNTGGVVMGSSFGAAGFVDPAEHPDVGNFDGAPGGTVSINMSGIIVGNGAGININVAGQYLDPTLSGIGAFSFGGEGVAAKVNDTDQAGTGGAGGMVIIDNTGQIIMANVNNTPTYGIYAVSQGGIGSNSKNYAYGTSGDGGEVDVTNAGSITDMTQVGIGIKAESIGAQSDDDQVHNNDDANDAGNGGAVNITLAAGSVIAMSGGGGDPSTDIGVLALSAAGNSGGVNDPTGGTVTVTLDGGSAINTTGANLSVGVLAISSGSIGAVQPDAQTIDATASPGSPGAVIVDNAGAIDTSGAMAVGIAGLSIGGSSIVTSVPASGGVFGNTDSYNGIEANTVTITNSGAVYTAGAASFGIAGISVGGGGGLLNGVNNNGTADIGSQNSGAAGGASNGAAVTVDNYGTIITGDNPDGGKVAIGIIAQSVGGGGGSSSAPARLIGGDDASGYGGGNGGAVDVESSGGNVFTYDEGAIGVLAQSVGGGGGNGANAQGIFAALGGAGGNGGAGGGVTVNLGVGGPQDLYTFGDFAAGVLAQSIGGGGGNGGYASTTGPLITGAIGGNGGGGGAGGTVALANGGTIATVGNQSHGLFAQSVGGGGGNGGAANSFAAGALSVSIAIGGTAGSGGSGGQVSVTNNYYVYTGCSAPGSACDYGNTGGPVSSAADSIGVLAQSIGGGGGNGGAATAKSLSLPDDEIPVSVTFDFALGGAGGSGGYGNTVTADNGGEIETAGDGSYGILAQSVGGGGGNGGDSTAAAYAIESAADSIKISTSLGGGGGDGGSGGSVTVSNGSSATCGGCDGRIDTYGESATGILAQSIGGGGGSGGSGNASASSPNLGGDTGTAVDLTASVGGGGGYGNVGGVVNVSNEAGSSVVTVGSGSQGILAQSIGGGGGAAGGGTAGSSGDNVNINVSVGGKGGTGNDGGTVTVSNDGVISTGGIYTNAGGFSFTTGGDGVGILAQSIGGGGGLAGSSDAAATINKLGQFEDALNAPSNSYSANIGVGGSGGAAGNGSTVLVTNTGSITTRGIRAYGVEAQSIGGGGGNGAAATSTSNSVLGGTSTDDEGASKGGTYSADVAVGGGGGAAGNGGSLTVSSSGGILTAGYSADGILAQSIGGGGGVGAEGTVDNTTTIGLGGGGGEAGGSGASGGNVNITTEPGGTITTLGDDAPSILAQSIGGGGGAGSAGCTNSGAVTAQGISTTACIGNSNDSVTSNAAPWNDASDFTLNIGGAAGDSGNGNNVTVNVGDAIVTTGARAMGVVAQSIGGGGGFVEAAAQNIAGTSIASSPGLSTGGPVSVTLAATGSIITSGAGAWGILAQSIGGGGGFDGDPSLLMGVPQSNTLAQTGSGNAYANNVGITANGNIITTGRNADGIVAQSIGGGGGIVAGCCNTAASAALAGDNAQIRSVTNPVWGNGGGVSIVQGAGSLIETSGQYATAILAQSSGNNVAQNAVNITIGGTVIGGTNDGVTLASSTLGATGIFVSGGLSAGGDWSGAGNAITIQPSGAVGTIDGIDGEAIATADNITSLVNNGTVTGNVDFGAGSAADGTVYSIFTNNGVFDSGPSVVAQSLTNNGIIDLGGAGSIGSTALTGNFVQNAGGTLAVDVNSLAPQSADFLSVSGTAQIAGTVAPIVGTALLPGTATIVSAGSLSLTASALQPLLYTWTLAQQGNSLTITPAQNFLTPRGATAPLTAEQSSLAGYLATAWNNNDAALATTFASLAQIPVGGGNAFVASVDAHSPRATQLEPTALKNSESGVLGAPMSCPMFEGQTIVLSEGSCVWAKAGGEDINQYATDGEAGFHTAGATYRLGGQQAFMPGWFLGGALGAETTWSNTAGSSSQGQTYDGSLALKHQIGDWLFAGSFGIASGAYRNDRVAVLPNGGEIGLQSDSNALMVGGRLRAAYDIPLGNWYVRPIADLDLLNISTPSFQESGPATYALHVRSSDSTNVVISPVVELGGRFNPDRGALTLRYYADLGVSFMPDNRRTVAASFVGALPADGSFATTIDSPDVLGDLDIGMQLYEAHGFEVKADYGARVGAAYFSQGGTLRLAYRF